MFKKVTIGLEDQFSALPIEIELVGSSYFLTRTESNYKLLSTTCPHAGGKVEKHEDCLECPLHGWKFSYSGESLNVPKQKLFQLTVNVENGWLVAEIPIAANAKRSMDQGMLKHELSTSLHAHACLEFKYKDFSLLTDPWLDGPAFLGSWIQYPQPVIEAKSLTPSAIWISHEHSDHFHEPTLKHFDRETPVYFPSFPNKRIESKLSELGFINTYPMSFGQPYEISKDFTITCFEPASLWNDSILLVEIDGYRILNINDAGLNPRIAQFIGPVDVLATAFSPGASGYPLTWTHLKKEKKQEILQNSRTGLLKMLSQAMDLYGAKSLIPFASHFSLWHPSHREYVDMLQKNTVMDVVEVFRGTDIKVIDLLPGDRWDITSNRISYSKRDRAQMYRKDEVNLFLDKAFDNEIFLECESKDSPLSYEEAESYFLKLNDTSEIVFCEDLKVLVKATDIEFNQQFFNLNFEIRQGQLEILRSSNMEPNLTIEVPLSILSIIVADNLSWDEAHIGYWCRFSRNPDVYHAGFWRLLQTPYFRENSDITKLVSPTVITGDTIIADLLELHGDEADRILRRYGLYCLGCHHSTFDTIAIGARNHVVNDQELDKLLVDLNRSLMWGATT